MGKTNDTEAEHESDRDTPERKPWETPGQSAVDPDNHPPPGPSRKEREQRHNETS